MGLTWGDAAIAVLTTTALSNPYFSVTATPTAEAGNDSLTTPCLVLLVVGTGSRLAAAETTKLLEVGGGFGFLGCRVALQSFNLSTRLAATDIDFRGAQSEVENEAASLIDLAARRKAVLRVVFFPTGFLSTGEIKVR